MSQLRRVEVSALLSFIFFFCGAAAFADPESVNVQEAVPVPLATDVSGSAFSSATVNPNALSPSAFSNATVNPNTLSPSAFSPNPFRESASTETAAPAKSKISALKSVGNKSKSLANFVLDLRGFDWSKEGADVLTDTELNPKNELAREYILRKQCDEREVKKSALLLQFALYADRDLNRTLATLHDLERVVGKEEARRLADEIMQLKPQYVEVSDPRLLLDFEQKAGLLTKILECSAKQDPVLCKLSARMGTYNHRSKAMRTTAKVVYSSLGIASFTPTLVAPIAEAALLSFMMATGGPEQDKLLKEIYIQKAMESRCRLLNEQAHLVMEGIDLARSTQNRRLLVCTQYLLQQMTHDDGLVTAVFPQSATYCVSSTVIEKTP